MKHKPVYYIIIIISFIYTSFFAHSREHNDAPTKGLYRVQFPRSDKIFYLEPARTRKQQSKGLMHRTKLADYGGMLFMYDAPTMAGIWMKNTYIPLDVVFLDCQKKIIKMVTRQPQTLNVTYPERKICYIIEVNAGLMKKINVRLGDKVQFRLEHKKKWK